MYYLLLFSECILIKHSKVMMVVDHSPELLKDDSDHAFFFFFLRTDPMKKKKIILMKIKVNRTTLGYYIVTLYADLAIAFGDVANIDGQTNG